MEDSEGVVKIPDSYGVYKLKPGTYNYTVTKDGFDTVTGSVTIIDEDVQENVVLEETV